MKTALEKALRRSSKVVNYLHHARPGSGGDVDEIGYWARAIDAAKIVAEYLEREQLKVK